MWCEILGQNYTTKLQERQTLTWNSPPTFSGLKGRIEGMMLHQWMMLQRSPHQWWLCFLFLSSATIYDPTNIFLRNKNFVYTYAVQLNHSRYLQFEHPLPVHHIVINLTVFTYSIYRQVSFVLNTKFQQELQTKLAERLWLVAETLVQTNKIHSLWLCHMKGHK